MARHDDSTVLRVPVRAEVEGDHLARERLSSHHLVALLGFERLEPAHNVGDDSEARLVLGVFWLFTRRNYM